MKRRDFVASSVGLITAVSTGVVEAEAKDRPVSPRSLIADLEGLEAWAKAMRDQLEMAGPGVLLDRRVLPSIAPWFGRILGAFASLPQA